MASAASAGERGVGVMSCCWDSSWALSSVELVSSGGIGGAKGETGEEPKSISKGEMLALDS